MLWVFNFVVSNCSHIKKYSTLFHADPDIAKTIFAMVAEAVS